MDPSSMLKQYGFRHALTLNWVSIPGTFKIVPINDDILKVRSVIYSWFDRHNNVVMNVGLTSQTLKARFINKAGYERWLNAPRKDTPIWHRWIDHIKTSQPGLIEIHIHEFTESLLEEEEHRFINILKPALNIRK